MANLEIERKFLVDKDNLPSLEDVVAKKITQGYIYSDDTMEVRIRSVETNNDSNYYFTVKKNGETAIKRTEIEVAILEKEFKRLAENLVPETNIIEKDRYLIPLAADLTAELDIYHSGLEGLATVEVEFKSEEEANNFVPPIWFLQDVTKDKSYKNKNLAKQSLLNKKKVKTLDRKTNH